MKYFITGATGFIGGHVARQLAAAGHHVTALVRNSAQAQDLAQLGLQLAPGDITDKESMRAPMTGVDGVFHLAAWYKVGARDKAAAKKINVGGTRNVLELMRELGIPKGVYTSTLAVNSDTHGQIVDEAYRFNGAHLSEYDRTKWQAHYAVALPLIAAGLPLVIVQPGVNYGPGDTSAIGNALRDYLRGRLPLVPDQVAYCWAHVADTARGHLLAMEKGRVGESYIIAGPPCTLVDALQLAEQITGIKAPRLKGSPGMLRVLAGMMGVMEKLVPVPENFASETLRVSAGATYLGSSAKAERELGFQARPLAEGLRETLAYEMKALGLAERN
ncbi:MAG: NAD-dependent epimerase/dehydratase family protein [Acidobacteria bacterium]|nr:NAD-dependent epimerase/dehydratase family protein [Acidobacteriota bacterium]MBI3428114.1 NAD-dependent epimerase/dehydratase family protein [Acidobacteriota bacterium]